MSTPTIEYHTIDKRDWAPGPWQDEPDKRQWSDPETGLACLIVRGPSGALCGYVGVGKAHAAHGMGYSQSRWDSDGEEVEFPPVAAAINDLRAHGGLTFSDSCGHGDDPSTGICHLPGEGEPDDVWWFGFDCAHLGDACPARGHRGYGGETYRDLPYVTGRVTELAAQLAAMAGAPQ